MSEQGQQYHPQQGASQEQLLLAESLLGVPLNYQPGVVENDVRLYAADQALTGYAQLMGELGGTITDDPGDRAAYAELHASLLPLARHVAIANNLAGWRPEHHPDDSARGRFQRLMLATGISQLQQYEPPLISLAPGQTIPNSLLFKAPTGSGKTLLAAMSMSNSGIGTVPERLSPTGIPEPMPLRGMLIVENRQLRGQFTGETGNNTFRRFYGRDVEMTSYWSEAYDATGDIVVVTRQILARAIARGHIIPEDYPLIVVDEAQLLLSPGMQELLPRLVTQSRVLAFTATPAYEIRKRDLRTQFNYVGGGSLRQFVEDGILSDARLYSFQSGGENGSPEGIAIRLAVNAINDGLKVAVYCQQGNGSAQAIAVAEGVNKTLKKEGSQYQDVARAVGNFNKTKRNREIEQEFDDNVRRMLSTVGLLRVGWDAEVDMVIFIDQSGSAVNVEQGIGRCMRPGDHTAYIMEVLPKEVPDSRRIVSIFDIFGLTQLISGTYIGPRERDEDEWKEGWTFTEEVLNARDSVDKTLPSGDAPGGDVATSPLATACSNGERFDFWQPSTASAEPAPSLLEPNVRPVGSDTEYDVPGGHMPFYYDELAPTEKRGPITVGSVHITFSDLSANVPVAHVQSAKPRTGVDVRPRTIATSLEHLPQELVPVMVTPQPVRHVTLSAVERIRMGEPPEGHNALATLATKYNVPYTILRVILDEQNFPYVGVYAKRSDPESEFERWYAREADDWLEQNPPEKIADSMQFTEATMARMVNVETLTISRFIRKLPNAPYELRRGVQNRKLRHYGMPVLKEVLKEYGDENAPLADNTDVMVWTLVQEYGDQVYNKLNEAKKKGLVNPVPKRPHPDTPREPGAKRLRPLHVTEAEAELIASACGKIRIATIDDMNIGDIAAVAGVSHGTARAALTEADVALMVPKRPKTKSRDFDYLPATRGLEIAASLRPRELPITLTAFPVMVARSPLTQKESIRAILRRAGYEAPSEIMNLGGNNMQSVHIYPWDAMRELEERHPPTDEHIAIDYDLLTGPGDMKDERAIILATTVLNHYLGEHRVDQTAMRRVFEARAQLRISHEQQQDQARAAEARRRQYQQRMAEKDAIQAHQDEIGVAQRQAREARQHEWVDLRGALSYLNCDGAAFSILYSRIKAPQDAIKKEDGRISFSMKYVDHLADVLAQHTPFAEEWVSSSRLDAHLKQYGQTAASMMKVVRLQHDAYDVRKSSTSGYASMHFTPRAAGLILTTAKRLKGRPTRE